MGFFENILRRVVLALADEGKLFVEVRQLSPEKPRCAACAGSGLLTERQSSFTSVPKYSSIDDLARRGGLKEMPIVELLLMDQQGICIACHGRGVQAE
jgi:hypothetical protein